MMKRIISLLAAFCLLLTMMPTSVWAKTITNTETPDKPTMTEFRQPQITGLEKLEKEPTILPPAKDPAQITANEDYVSMEEAVAQLRQRMMNREESITIKVKTTNSNSSDVFTNLFYDAMEHTGEPGAGDNLMWQWGYLSAGDGFSGYTSGGYYYYTLPYEIDYYTTAAMEAELDTAVEELLDDLNLYSASDYDKISGVYEYITENITYDHYNLNRDPNYEPMYTAYAALVDGTAVCQGYANLFYRLMLELDVDTRIVVGDAGGPHAWNIVELEDWYYYVDSTWDASYAQAGWGYQYYLLGSNNFSLEHSDDPEECPFLPDYPISYTDYVPGQPGQDPPPETWPKSGYCGDDMTWTLTEEGFLTISGTGEMWDFEYSDPEWYPYVNQIRECVVEEGVTDLGDYAFYKCYSLSSIDLPNSLQYTGEGAFTYCESLTEVTIPDNVTAIGRQTFAGCSALTSVTIPASVIRIGEIAFLYCYALQDVYYGGSPSQWAQIEIQEDNECLLDATIHYGAEDPDPGTDPDPDPDPNPDPDEVYTGYCGGNVIWSLTPDGMLTISGTGPMWDYPSSEPGWYAYVDQVEECVIEAGVTSIGAWAFWDCWALERIAVEEGLSLIGEGAFAYCYGLRELNLPVSITTIDMGAFYDCYSLSDVYYAGSAAQWSEIFIDELNEDLLSATIHYGVEDPTPEPELPEADFLAQEWELLKLVNRERANAGLAPLTTSELLFRATDARALELMENYSYTRPDGSSFDSVLFELGLEYRMAGEAIDRGNTDPADVIQAWMNNSDGRGHILNSNYAHMGAGFKTCDDDYGAYWEQMFYTDEYCHYNGLELNMDALTVEQGTSLEDVKLWATFVCAECGVCYLPVLDEYCYGYDPDTPGTQTVTVSALNFSDILEVTVVGTEPDPDREQPIRLELVNPPDADCYAVGENVDLSGIRVEAVYEDGDRMLLTSDDLTLESADTSTVGVQTAVVSYMGLTAEFPIYVHPSRMYVNLDPSLWPESSHGYGNNMDDSQYISYNGADSLILTFSDATCLEYGYDFLYVYDAWDNEIACFTGDEAAGMTVTVPGSVARIRLVSDVSYTEYGYALSAATANVLEHVGEAVERKEPDCITDGVTGGIVCEICGQTAGGQRIPALGHEWGSWQYMENRIDMYRVCSRCEEYDYLEAEIFTSAGDSEYDELSMAEIRALYETVDWDMQAEYAVQPSLSVPYAAGRLTDDALDNLTAQLNFFRRLAKLDNAGWDEELVQYAQAATLVNAVNNYQTHYPNQPSDMAVDLYEQGYTGASRSNLAWGTNVGMMDSVLLYLDDSDFSNIDRLGHRRWLLNPRMGLTGFGMTSADSRSHYHATYALDYSNSANTDADFTAYPGGNRIYPSEFFAYDVAWSVQLNRDTFREPSADEITVTLTRQSDGKQWVFGSQAADSEAGYFNVDTAGYGDSYAVIFRPADVSEYEGVYDVLVSGLQTDDGDLAAIEYSVDFRSMDEPEPEPEPEPDPAYGTCGMSEEAVYEILIGMKDEYYEGRPWTNDDSYRWNINNTVGYGCAAFAFILSDAAFGHLPSRTIYDDITIDDLRVGDILRVYNDSHSVVVLEVHDDYIVIAEGNFNYSIHWGRTMTAEDVAVNTDYVVTRYPEHNFVDGVCTECGAEEEGYEPPVEYGDMNGDGEINTLDLVMLRKYLNGADVELDETAADVNGNGEINTLDLVILRKYLNGDDVPLGAAT